MDDVYTKPARWVSYKEFEAEFRESTAVGWSLVSDDLPLQSDKPAPAGERARRRAAANKVRKRREKRRRTGR